VADHPESDVSPVTPRVIAGVVLVAVSVKLAPTITAALLPLAAPLTLLCVRRESGAFLVG